MLTCWVQVTPELRKTEASRGLTSASSELLSLLLLSTQLGLCQSQWAEAAGLGHRSHPGPTCASPLAWNALPCLLTCRSPRATQPGLSLSVAPSGKPSSPAPRNTHPQRPGTSVTAHRLNSHGTTVKSGCFPYCLSTQLITRGWE